ncbi:sensor histidine kinase [Ornithinimicrobium ciconiae]|uniref:histidine kinase n=1 Tax=Ornithinimicrobium ciconiae TaxID=2594265 RepID=A0A516GEX2_9MICO|nr:sensor histidine kinase [Ornithinimicrobium ciconiae]
MGGRHLCRGPDRHRRPARDLGAVRVGPGQRVERRQHGRRRPVCGPPQPAPGSSVGGPGRRPGLARAGHRGRRRAHAPALLWSAGAAARAHLHDRATRPGGLPLGGAAAVAAFIVFADLYVPLLADPSELIFHWSSLILVWLTGHGLRVAANRAATEAVRAHLAEATSREAALRAISDERARIARELHDIVAHSVGVIVVQAGAAEQVVEEDPEFARRALATIRATGAGALVEMRRVVTMLRDPDLGHDLAPQPGIAALPDLVTSARDAGLQVDLEVTGERPSLPAGLDLTAYRVVQEALTNVRRHSEATCAQVAMAFVPGALKIEVSDAGPPRSADHEAGHGLLGMRERVALFGGQVETDTIGGVFTVRAVLPLEGS